MNKEKHRDKPLKSIREMWEDSDRRVAHILANPWRYPLDYLDLVLNHGYPIRPEKAPPESPLGAHQKN